MLTVTILVFLITWAILKYILHIRHTESYVKHIKGQKSFIPFIGNAFACIGKSPTQIFRGIIQSIEKNDTPFKEYIGPGLTITLDKPDDIKAVLMSPHCLDKPYYYGFYPCPRGIFTEQSGALWKPSRKLLNPMFNLKTLQSFIPIFNQKTRRLVKELEEMVGKPAFDIGPSMNTCTLDAICSTVMGLDIDLKSNKGKEFIQSLSEILRIVMKRLTMPWIHLDFFYRWTSLYKEQQKHLANIRYLTNLVFDEKITAYMSRSDNTTQEEYIEKISKRAELPFIPLFIEGKLSEEVVKQQIEIMLNVGHETTGSTTAYVILMLAMHLNIQDQVLDELRSIFDTQDEETTYEHIQKMHLLDRVIKETMRLFPVGPFLERISTADVPISNCVLPKSTVILICFYTLHRRQDIWGVDANKFNPDNFLPEKVQSRHAFSFLPFSGGPRNCIGYQYAMFSMKVMLATLLRNYQFSTDLKWTDLELKLEITLKLENKCMVEVAPRHVTICSILSH
ncbi:cytochrome P450 4C1-like [Sitodiplosis mosellana]|uniref:cytochrome P450 4C1-like n=1 Tax=Sitodiplosis mosellana TaxID=263140 RepID=UPI002444C630|nr:cytochrome P450 4C1-like [Sitodiplosis mosellana]